MANSPQARKRARQNVVRHARNQSQRSTMRTYIKRFLKAISDQDRAAADSAYRSAVSLIDRAARKGLQHPNRASRLKGRLNARLHNLSASA